MDEFFRLTKNRFKMTILGVTALALLSGCNSAGNSDSGQGKAAGPGSVVKAKVDIPKGLKFTNEMLEMGQNDKAAKSDGAFRSKDQVVGKTAGKNITTGTAITRDLFEKDEEESPTESSEDGTKTDTAQVETQE